MNQSGVRISIILGLLGLLLAMLPDGAAAETVPLRVMTFNIFYGGDEFDLHTGTWCSHPDGCAETLDAVIDAITEAAPDVIGFEEAERSSCVIAERLGWHCSARTQVISRFPLIDPPGANGVYVFIELAPGRVAAIANVHLPSDPYGPYLVRDGATLEEVLANEAVTRMPFIQTQLAVLPSLVAAGIPVFLVGDFNTPSHLDWTGAVAAVRPEVRYPIDWPVSKATEAAGFRDSYREAHPDPVAVPGFTWTPGGPESDRREVHDRIDWVLVAGPAETTASEILGETGGPDVTFGVDPFPSDHRGAVSTFSVTPAVSPVLVAVDRRRVFVGDALSVSYHAAGAGEQVAILPAGGSGADALDPQSTDPAAPVDGSVTFDTAALDPGAYEAALLDSVDNVLSRAPFWLYRPGAPTEVFVSKSSHKVGEPIVVSWRNAPGNRWDWLAVFAPGSASDRNPIAQTCNSRLCTNGHYLLYLYTRTAIEGAAQFDETSFPGWVAWPLKPGTYKIRLLLDDGYRAVASSTSFKVRN